MITEEEALAWAVREGISRAGGPTDDPELFTKVLGEVHKIITEPPPAFLPSKGYKRRDTPTYPTIKVPLDRKAVLIALTLLMGDDDTV